ncbi:MAG: DUF3244 domain-containing protein [Bacteroidaceae bacterium]|nr:DUF3244 domain-containing protein [Bacteroidaceae bacterium]
MKKKLFLTMTLLLIACCGINAQTVILFPPPPPKPKSLTEMPEVKAYYTSDTLTVSITGYYGDVEVTVEDAATNTIQTTQTEYVFGQGTVVTDITSLTSGYYVLYIRLDDDEEYVGYFSK